MIVRVAGSFLVRLDGGRLAELRRAHDLSLAEVGDACGVSTAAACAWEAERYCPTAPSVDGLRELYGDALASSGALTVESL